jgi:hypothetical protein
MRLMGVFVCDVYSRLLAAAPCICHACRACTAFEQVALSGNPVQGVGTLCHV